MAEKQPMQASRDTSGSKDGDKQPGLAGGTGAGESGGGAYPNPAEHEPGSQGSFLGHGGQSDIAYHGHGQLGTSPIEGEENANSATKRD